MERRILTPVERVAVGQARPFDRHLKGGTRVATPTGRADGVRIRSDARPSELYGHTIALATGAQVFHGGGTPCQWSRRAHPTQAGWPDFRDRTTRLFFPILAYYDLKDLHVDWDTYRYGGTITVRVSGVVVFSRSWPFAIELSVGTIDLGVCGPDDYLEVFVSPVGEPGVQPDGQVADVTCSLAVDELPVDTRTESMITGDYRAWIASSGSNSNNLILRRRVQDGPMDTVAVASFSGGTNTWYGLRARRDGATIRARVWVWTDPEPSGWMAEWTDPEPLGDGYPGLSGGVATDGTRQYDLLEADVDGALTSDDFGAAPLATGMPPGWVGQFGSGDGAWRVVADAGATGGQRLEQSAAADGGAMRTTAGRSRTMEVLTRMRRTSNADHIGVILSGSLAADWTTP